MQEIIQAIETQIDLISGLKKDLQDLLEVQRKALEEMEQLTNSFEKYV